MWVHRKYIISIIISKFYSFESNDWTYLSVHNDGGMNQRNYGTYDLQWTNGEMMTTIKIITDRMSMHYSINTYK